MMKFIGIIPARYASTRFPGKPLADMNGKPMIQRVYEQVKDVLDSVCVATDDIRIENAVKAFGGQVVMTSDQHRSGTDRCYEAYQKIGEGYDVIVNIQGDEPFIHPEQIQKARAEAEKGKRVRGASTISQQTAKNVFLWPGKSYLRKGIEVYFTFLIEWIWGKERIMEVYLNSIEMGEGIYGAEAVAEAHFGKHAYQLTKSEAALIAATLPNPRKFNSAKPSPYMLKRQAKIISLMGKLIKVEMGYGAGQVDPGTGKVKKRKKWRASVIMTWDESLMPMR